MAPPVLQEEGGDSMKGSIVKITGRRLKVGAPLKHTVYIRPYDTDLATRIPVMEHENLAVALSRVGAELEAGEPTGTLTATIAG